MAELEMIDEGMTKEELLRTCRMLESEVEALRNRFSTEYAGSDGSTGMLSPGSDIYGVLCSGTFGGIAIHDSGVIKDCNEGLSVLSGYPINELRGMQLLHLCEEDSRKTAEPFVLGGRELSCEVTARRKDGVQFPARLESRNLLFFGENVRVTEIRDISELKAAEAARQDSEQMLRTLMDQASEALFIHETDGAFIDVNNQACVSLGYSREELLRMSVTDVEVNFDLPSAQAVWRTIQPGVPYRLEGRHKRKDGTTFPVEVHFGCTEWKKRKLFLTLVSNISDRKQAESGLRQSEELFRVAFEDASVGMCLVDVSGKFMRVNSSMCEMVGYTTDELLTLSIRDITHPNYRVETGRYPQLLLMEAIEHGRHEKRYMHKDGQELWCQSSVAVVRDTAGEPGHFIISLHDTTARKRSEHALRRSEEKYRLLFESNPHPMWAYDIETLQFLEVNHAAIVKYGYSKDEFLSMTLEGIRPPQEVERLRENVRVSVQEGVEYTHSGDWLHRDKSGTIFSVEIISHGLEINGRPARLVLANDISERKRYETMLVEEKQKFLRLASTSPGAICSFRMLPEGEVEFLYASMGMQDLYGHHPVEFLKDGSIASRAVHPEDLTRLQEAAALSARQLTPLREEYRLNHPEKGTVWLEAHFMPEREPDGGTIWHGIITDRTDSRTAEIALRESDARYQSALENMLEGCQILGFDWRYIYINDAAEVHNKRPKEELLGQKYMDMWPGIEATRVFELIRSCLEERVRSFMENRFVYPDGSIGWFELRIHPAPEGVMILSLDITERKFAEIRLRGFNAQLEERIRDRTEQLEASNRELEAFSYSVSHDLRAPLRSISGFASILLEDFGPQLGSEGERICNIISSSAQRMGQLIDDLLAFSRLARKELNKIRVDTKKLLRALFFELTTEDQRRNIEFIYEDVEDCFGDPSLLRQAVSNLLSNAIKFTSKTNDARILASTRRESGNLILTISDNGAGFDMQYKDKLFGVFQRLHGMDEFEGTGVGLAIVRRIIERHGGTVDAFSEINRGATFSIKLPEPPPRDGQPFDS